MPPEPYYKLTPEEADALVANRRPWPAIPPPPEEYEGFHWVLAEFRQNMRPDDYYGDVIPMLVLRSKGEWWSVAGHFHSVSGLYDFLPSVYPASQGLWRFVRYLEIAKPSPNHEMCR